MTIKYEIVATTGTYTDRDGNEKRRYENVGHVPTHEGRFYITKREFSCSRQNGSSTALRLVPLRSMVL